MPMTRIEAYAPGGRFRRGLPGRLILPAVCVAAGIALASGGTQGADAAADWQAVVTTVFPPGRGLAVILLLAASAFFSASEVAFFSTSRVRFRAMRDHGGPLASLASRLMEEPSAVLATILMGNSLVNVLLGISLGESLAELLERLGGARPGAAYGLSTLVTTMLLVFFGEMLPKALTLRRADRFAMVAAPGIWLASLVLRPIRVVVTWLVGLLFRLSRISELPPAPFLTDEEFLLVLEDGGAPGVIEEDERQMIRGILQFGDRTVRDILVPRMDIVALPESATAADALAVFREHEYARMPVYRDNLDTILGLVYAKDLIQCLDDGRMATPVTALMRPAHFVPETMTLADFMKHVQRYHAHLAVVVDEYGGTRGIVTLQDALREVVGDIGDDEDASEEPRCEQIAPGEYLVDGSYSLEKLEELIGIRAEDEEHTTLGGFLMSRAERVLNPGDSLELDGVTYRIEAMNDKRVTRVRLWIQESPDDNQEEDAI